MPFFFVYDKYSMTTESHLGVKQLSSTIVAVVAIMGAFWAIDSHYAAAADVHKLQQSIESQVRLIRQERIEDEIFKLDVKKEQRGKLTPEEAALYQRYTRRLQQTVIEQRLQDKAEQTK